jgi:peroxiredoxin
MALTESRMIELGTKAPDFTLPDPSGDLWRLSDFEGGEALLVVFMCNHCPFVKHLKPALAALTREMKPRGLESVAISANDIESHPADAPEKMAEEAKQFGYVFPYLYDESQETARAYGALCTPDFFLFDRERRLAYRGQFDDSRPGDGKPVTGADLRAAIEALLSGQRPSEDQKPSIGCNIKWKAAG